LIFDDSVAINRNGLPGLDLGRVGSGRVGSSMRDELVWALGFVGVFTMLLLSGFGHQRVRLHGPLKDLLEKRSGSVILMRTVAIRFRFLFLFSFSWSFSHFEILCKDCLTWRNLLLDDFFLNKFYPFPPFK